MRTDGIRLFRTGRCSRIPSPPMTLEQAGEQLAELHRDGIKNIAAENADGSPLTAAQNVALLRHAMEAL